MYQPVPYDSVAMWGNLHRHCLTLGVPILFRYPDKPGSELPPSFLHVIKPDRYFAKLKYDGWRCIVTRRDGVFTYVSRVNKPIAIPESVRVPFERDGVARFDMVLDCELLGNRRAGDAADIKVIDLLELNGTDVRNVYASVRHRMMEAILVRPWYMAEVEYGGFVHFFNYHKERNALAEGIVLYAKEGIRYDSPLNTIESKHMIKCKWRSGFDGLSPTEIE